MIESCDQHCQSLILLLKLNLAEQGNITCLKDVSKYPFTVIVKHRLTMSNIVPVIIFYVV